MSKIIPLYKESYDELRARWEGMEINEVFMEWLQVKDAEVKEALRVYVKRRMAGTQGIELY